MTEYSRLKYLSIVTVVVSLIFCGSAIARSTDDLSLFTSKFGQPDQIKSSEYENPRPPIVTKQLIYKKENVRVVYVPDAPVGSPPPYQGWKLLGFQDQKTNQVLKVEEVARRMEKRKKGLKEGLKGSGSN